MSGTREAELTKLLENTFRHVNIALVNELAMFAGELGIDVWEAIGAASSKPFGYMPFTPGPGVGWALPSDRPELSVVEGAKDARRSFRFVELANDVNEHMPDYVVQRLVLALNRMGATGERMRRASLGYGVQEEHRRRPRGPRQRSSPDGSRASAHMCTSPIRTYRWIQDRMCPGRGEPLRSSPTPTRWSIVTDHDCFDYEMIAEHARFVLDTRNRMRGPTAWSGSEPRGSEAVLYLTDTMDVLVTGGAGFIGANLS